VSVTPTGILSLPLARLRTLVAACSAWTSWGGALGDIYMVTAEPTSVRPFAVITDSDEWIAESDSSDPTAVNFRENGTLLMTVEADVDADHSVDDAAFDFRNNLGALIEDMMDLSGTGGTGAETLWIMRVRMIDPPMRAHPDIRNDQGDFYQATLAIEYGSRQ